MPNYVQLRGAPPNEGTVVVNPEGVDALVPADGGQAVTVYLRGGKTVLVSGTVEKLAKTLSGRRTLEHQRGSDDG